LVEMLLSALFSGLASNGGGACDVLSAFSIQRGGGEEK
jgi:hypothetical protein